MELVYSKFCRLGRLIAALVFLATSSMAQAQFDPFPTNTVDCGIVCSPACDDSGGGDDDPLCELLGTCDPGECDATVQSCIGDDDGGGDDGCEGADCGNNDPCSVGGVADGSAGAPNGSTGNPINLISGNKYKRQVDLEALPGVISLEFVRHYNSAYSKSVGLGRGWRHSYSTILSVQKGFRPGEMDSLKVQQADGRILLFNHIGDRKAGAQYQTKNHHDGYITTTDFGYQWRWRSGRVVSFDDRGLMTQIQQAGHTLKLQYGGDGGRLISVTDPQGRRLSLHYNRQRLAGFTDPSGNATQFKFDSQERLVNVIRPENSVRVYHYQDKTHIWNLTGITDERGIRVQSYGYDESGRAVSSTKNINTEQVSVSYDDENDLRILTDSQGIKTTYVLAEIAGQKVISQVRGPGCSVCQTGDVEYEYNDALQVTKTKHKNGFAADYNYDSRGRLISEYRSEAGVPSSLWAKYQYEGNMQLPSKVLRPSVKQDDFRVTQYEYDSSGRIVTLLEKGFSPITPLSEIDDNTTGFISIKRVTSLEYDGAGNLVSIDGPRTDVADVASFSYDTLNRLIEAKSADGGVRRVLSYDVMGRPTKVAINKQPIVSIEYGFGGQPVKVIRGEQSLAYRYDKIGNLVAIVDAAGNAVEYQYDSSGRLTLVKRNDGPTVELEFDGENHVISRKTSNSVGDLIDAVDFIYDSKGRLSELSQNGVSKRYGYNANDQLNWVDHGHGQITNIATSMEKRLLTMTSATGWSTSVNFDLNGDAAGITDANGNVTEKLKDDFGQVITLNSADTGSTYYAYDEAGNKVAIQTSSGSITRNEYDSSNRVTKKTIDGALTLYEYAPITGELVL